MPKRKPKAKAGEKREKPKPKPKLSAETKRQYYESMRASDGHYRKDIHNFEKAMTHQHQIALVPPTDDENPVVLALLGRSDKPRLLQREMIQTTIKEYGTPNKHEDVTFKLTETVIMANDAWLCFLHSIALITVGKPQILNDDPFAAGKSGRKFFSICTTKEDGDKQFIFERKSGNNNIDVVTAILHNVRFSAKRLMIVRQRMKWLRNDEEFSIRVKMTSDYATTMAQKLWRAVAYRRALFRVCRFDAGTETVTRKLLYMTVHSDLQESDKEEGVPAANIVMLTVGKYTDALRVHQKAHEVHDWKCFSFTCDSSRFGETLDYHLDEERDPKIAVLHFLEMFAVQGRVPVSGLYKAMVAVHKLKWDQKLQILLGPGKVSQEELRQVRQSRVKRKDLWHDRHSRITEEMNIRRETEMRMSREVAMAAANAAISRSSTVRLDGKEIKAPKTKRKKTRSHSVSKTDAKKQKPAHSMPRQATPPPLLSRETRWTTARNLMRQEIRQSILKKQKSDREKQKSIVDILKKSVTFGADAESEKIESSGKGMTIGDIDSAGSDSDDSYIPYAPALTTSASFSASAASFSALNEKEKSVKDDQIAALERRLKEQGEMIMEMKNEKEREMEREREKERELKEVQQVQQSTIKQKKKKVREPIISKKKRNLMESIKSQRIYSSDSECDINEANDSFCEITKQKNKRTKKKAGEHAREPVISKKKRNLLKSIKSQRQYPWNSESDISETNDNSTEVTKEKSKRTTYTTEETIDSSSNDTKRYSSTDASSSHSADQESVYIAAATPRLHETLPPLQQVVSKKTVRLLEEKIMLLQDDLEQSERKNKMLKQQNHESKSDKKVRRLEEKILLLQDDLEQSERRNKMLKQEISEFELHHVSKSDKKVRRLEEKIMALQDDLEQTEVRNSEQSEKIHDLKKHHTSKSDKTIRKLEEKIIILNDKLEESEMSNHMQCQEISDLKHRHSYLVDETTKYSQLKEHVRELEETLLDRDESIEAKDEEIDALKQELKEQEQKMMVLRKEKDAFKSTVKTLKKTVKKQAVQVKRSIDPQQDREKYLHIVTGKYEEERKRIAEERSQMVESIRLSVEEMQRDHERDKAENQEDVVDKIRQRLIEMKTKREQLFPGSLSDNSDLEDDRNPTDKVKEHLQSHLGEVGERSRSFSSHSRHSRRSQSSNLSSEDSQDTESYDEIEWMIRSAKEQFPFLNSI